MPTFKLSDEEPLPGYMGDSDMYFRQWRMQSMKPVLEEKLDRHFAEAQNRQENMQKQREIRKKQHSAKFDEKMKKLSMQFETVTIDTREKEAPIYLQKASEEEKRIMREAIDREYAHPSSTARMIPARQLPPRPMKNPIFGNNMVARTNIVKNIAVTEAAATPNSLNTSQESVFFPQEHSSFNLDGYNGARPSFAFFGNAAATSTPVSKIFPKFSVGSQISEENSSFDNSKYVTAMESPQSARNEFRAAPIALQLKTPEEKERQRELETQREKLKEEEAEKQRVLETQRVKLKEEEAEKQRELETQRKLEENSTLEEDSKKEEEEEGKRPFQLFEKYAKLIKRIEQESRDYEKNADPKFRALLKRTITEKVTVFTHRQTSETEKKIIIEFFRTLLKKIEVKGYSLNNGETKLQLKNDADVQYSIYCILDKYLSLVELNTPTSMEELTTSVGSSFVATIGDLISKISASARKMETIFISMIMTRSVVLRQIPEECIKVFEEDAMKLDSSEQAMVMNREKCLVELFITVFVKNALFASRNVKLNLNDELLWEYAECVLNWCVEVPKSSTVLAYLLTIAKYRLEMQNQRWLEFMDYLTNDALPTMIDYQQSGESKVHDSSVTYLEEIVKILKI